MFDYDVVIVCSVMEIWQVFIDQCLNFKIIVWVGVGLSNIDVEYVCEKGIIVMDIFVVFFKFVVELVFVYMFFISCNLYLVYWEMKQCGGSEFKEMKEVCFYGL